MIQTEDKAEHMLRTILTMLCRHTQEPLVWYDSEREKFFVKVDGLDQGRCIGKKGMNIWAIGALMWMAGIASQGLPLEVQLLEPDRPAGKTPALFRANQNWDREAIKRLVRTILQTCMKHGASFELMETGEAEATLIIEIDQRLRKSLTDPSLEDALKTLVHAIGMAQGVVIEVEVKWT